MIRIYKLDVNKSEIAWVGYQPSNNQSGILSFKEGKFYTKDRHLMEGNVLIDMRSIEVTSESLNEEDQLKLGDHLISKDFFDVEKYPTSEFMFLDIKLLDTNEEISSPGDPAIKVHTHEVEGELTIKGITQRVKFPVYFEIDGHQLKAESKFLLYRTKWGMDFMIESSYGDKKILPEVQVSFDIIAWSTHQKGVNKEEGKYYEEEIMESID